MKIMHFFYNHKLCKNKEADKLISQEKSLDVGCSNTHCTKYEVFSLRLYSVNVTKSAQNCGFGHIC